MGGKVPGGTKQSGEASGGTGAKAKAGVKGKPKAKAASKANAKAGSKAKAKAGRKSRGTGENMKLDKLNEKNKVVNAVAEVSDRELIERRKNREKLPVMFIKKRVAVQFGDTTWEPKEVWVGEHIRANFQSRLITKEYYGTMPFDSEKLPEVDKGIYDDYEQSVIYKSKDGTENVVDCVFTLVPISEGILKVMA